MKQYNDQKIRELEKEIKRLKKLGKRICKDAASDLQFTANGECGVTGYEFAEKYKKWRKLF